MTAEEKACMASFIENACDCAQAVLSATYHSLGVESFDPETGAVTETGGTNVSSVNVLKITPSLSDTEEMKVSKAEEVYLLLASDLSAITPKPSDYITISSVRKEIRSLSKPVPYIHYRLFTADIGNA